MISQGTDGLSRGDLSEGVMRGKRMLSFVPLHLSALERSYELQAWIRSWIEPCLKNEEQLEFLTPEDWFHRGHDFSGGSKNGDGVWIPSYRKGLYVWTPAPAAAAVAVEQLREARNKRTDSLHIVIIPRLFTSLWRRQLMRSADIFCEFPFMENA